jgi:iron transport multicopper oxidase
MTNIGAFAGQYFWIEGHTMRVIEVDGVWTEPADTDMIYLTAAQRYGFLVTMKNDTSKNFAMVGSMDEVNYPLLGASCCLIDIFCRAFSIKSHLI